MNRSKSSCLIAFALASTLFLGACGSDADEADAGTPSAGTDAAVPFDPAEMAAMGAAGGGSAPAAANAPSGPVPSADMSRPLESYSELNSGNQLMFMYLAASNLPPDYEKVAGRFSPEYRKTSDAFRRNDLMKALRPQLDARIAETRANPYAWMELDGDVLGEYDFDRRGFVVAEFTGSSGARYFFDNNAHSLEWANPEAVGFLPVADEAVAREIESLRTGNYSRRPTLKVYFFAQSANVSEENVRGYVTRIQLLDPRGRVLAESGPAA